jgi:hypothetical protein
METDILILNELRELRRDVKRLSPDQFQNIPDASKTLGVSKVQLKKLCDLGIIPCSLLNTTSMRKRYLIDIPGTKKFIEEGGIIPNLLKGKPC